jgi:hypothetical protein
MNKMESKSLKEKFLEGERLGLLDNLRIKTLQIASDCDGMCDKAGCNQWYCETYKNKQLNYQTN